MIYYITSSEYADYIVHGVFEGPENVDLKALITKYKEGLS